MILPSISSIQLRHNAWIRHVPSLARAALVVLLYGGWISAAQASVITTDCNDVDTSCTMQELFAGGTIQVHDKLFWGWRPFIEVQGQEPVFAESSAGNLASEADSSNIIVSGITGNILNPGISYSANGQWSAVGSAEPATHTISWAFQVSVVGNEGFLIHDNTLTLGLPSIRFPSDGVSVASVDVLELVYAESFNPGDTDTPDPLVSKLVFLCAASVNGDSPQDEEECSNLSDHKVFEPQSSVFVSTSIHLAAQDSSIAVNTLTQHFSQTSTRVSEPGVIALLGIALVGLGFTRRASNALNQRRSRV